MSDETAFLETVSAGNADRVGALEAGLCLSWDSRQDGSTGGWSPLSLLTSRSPATGPFYQSPHFPVGKLTDDVGEFVHSWQEQAPSSPSGPVTSSMPRPPCLQQSPASMQVCVLGKTYPLPPPSLASSWLQGPKMARTHFSLSSCCLSWD